MFGDLRLQAIPGRLFAIVGRGTEAKAELRRREVSSDETKMVPPSLLLLHFGLPSFPPF